MTQYKNLKHFLFIKECIVLALVVSSLIFLAIEQFGHLSEAQLGVVDVYDVIVGLIFIGEFMLELWLTSNKKRYVKNNWFYLFAAIPLPYATVQLLRGLRVIRVIKLIRSGAHFEYEKNTKNNRRKLR